MICQFMMCIVTFFFNVNITCWNLLWLHDRTIVLYNTFTSFFLFLLVTPQAPSSALPTQAGVGVATTVHLNHMQLMAVDRIGLQSAQISTQGIQPAPIAAQGIQPAPIGVQGLHTSAPITTQGIQQTPIVTQQQQQQQAQAEAKPGICWIFLSWMFLRCVGSFMIQLFHFLRCCFGWWLCCKPHNQHIQCHPASTHLGAGTCPRSRRSSHFSVFTSTQHSSQEARHWGVGIMENWEGKTKTCPKDVPFPYSYLIWF